MLNPFHGVVSVVEIEGADAVSRDGVHWTLYVHGEQELEALADGSLLPVELPDIKFGVWSAHDGLRRAPVRAVADYAGLDAVGSTLLAAVKRCSPMLPFPAQDRFELWLLDTDDAPLALLDSACCSAEIVVPDKVQWRPGVRAVQEFVSADGAPLAQRLTELVQARAGATPRAQWWLRNPDGSGTALEGFGIAAPLHGRRLPGSAFPELLLAERGFGADDTRLLGAYLDWLAPWLLQLELSPDSRRRMEPQAWRQALRVRSNYHLYPQVFDEDGLIAALVEARLRDTIPAQGVVPDESLLPFFNE